MSNRYKHANSVPVAALSRWVIVALFLGASGLSYVYLKNQMHATGDEIRNLERQLADLETQSDIVNGRVSQLAARGYLQKKRAEGFIHLTPITDDRIIRIAAVAPVPAARSELRRVSNEESVK
jgi:hypothetical protein